ncbi:MAG: sortase [Mollicutes bacterium]|nr:sortase [Mollicutes bacterium]MDY5874654.1 sortase [Bacilli bacterium]
MYTKTVRKPNKNKRISPSETAFIGAIITLIGGFFISYNYIESQKIMAYDYMANAFYDGNQVTVAENENNQTEEKKEGLSGEITNDYIGYLNIPKINLTKGFLDNRSSENDVEKNILVVEGSNYPDVDKGNFILAGHSGTGWKAFFNDLYKLSAGDTAKITYKDKTYTYQITNIYKQPKTGKLAIYRNYDKTTLTLITCTNNDSTTQTIYIAELINKE